MSDENSTIDTFVSAAAGRSQHESDQARLAQERLEEMKMRRKLQRAGTEDQAPTTNADATLTQFKIDENKRATKENLAQIERQKKLNEIMAARKKRREEAKSKQLGDEAEAQEIKEMFDLLDADHSGEIDKLELKTLCENIGAGLNVNSLIKGLDKNNNNRIDLEEFTCLIKGTYGHSLEEQAAELKEIFELLDEDGSGTLTADEFTEGAALFADSDERVKELLDMADPDGTGEIRYDLFVKMFKETGMQ